MKSRQPAKPEDRFPEILEAAWHNPVNCSIDLLITCGDNWEKRRAIVGMLHAVKTDACADVLVGEMRSVRSTNTPFRYSSSGIGRKPLMGTSNVRALAGRGERAPPVQWWPTAYLPDPAWRAYLTHWIADVYVGRWGANAAYIDVLGTGNATIDYMSGTASRSGGGEGRTGFGTSRMSARARKSAAERSFGSGRTVPSATSAC